VDGSVSNNQGMRIIFKDGSRIIFRLSGTAGSGATIRMYLEKYIAASAGAAAFSQPTAEVMQVLVQLALGLSDMQKITGRASPSVIT
jgi:phosphoglucomutase